MNSARTKWAGIFSAIMILSFTLLVCGCLAPGVPGGPAQATETPTISPVGTETTRTGTAPEGVIVLPEGSEMFVTRPWGYEKFVPNPALHATLQETRVETDSSGRLYLTGRIKNDSEYTVEYIEVTFNLFNANGALIGNAVASAYFLPAGKTWVFRTNSFDASGYQFNELADIFTA
ncbi:hypothetical protein J2741_001319 [Methanolinea mesophila]|uniref:FxLYD domain-containing protein n=1 Tax=Methanolinea mesophila TaxID=547055 RepID=UPI001AEA7B28|nr:FxLYD domain-containing protein [Methanolinea mesophila]MBP1928772.1 hypothetical protein [Methanolinea mesophila]